MKSEMPKVLFQVNDEPLCFGPYRSLFSTCDKILVVIGYRGFDVQKALTERAIEVFGEEGVRSKTVFFTQDPPRGTGDAVRTALQNYGKSLLNQNEVLVVNGDMPLLRVRTLEKFVKTARDAKLDSACVSVRPQNRTGLGRIVRDTRGVFTNIREEADANAEEKSVREVNAGLYYFRSSFLADALSSLEDKNSQNEFYLTDLLGNSSPQRRSEAILARSPLDYLGVNTTYELSIVRGLAQARLQKNLCEKLGVELANPESTFISARAEFTGPAYLGPATCILGKTRVESNVRIEGSSRIESCILEENAKILWGSALEEARVGKGSQVGPLAHLRPGSVLDENVKIGNFVELKKTHMHKGSKASHLSYLGDATVGEEANIGCGTITCNFDGFNKHRTEIGKRAFIGSDTQLLAPVSVGDEAYVASGTTVTQDVPAGALALSRAELTLKPGYAKRLADRLKMKKEKTNT